MRHDRCGGRPVELDGGAGRDEERVVDAQRRQVVDEGTLVGKDVALLPEVVDREEVVVEERGRAGVRQDPTSPDRLGKAPRTVHAVGALALAEPLLHVLGQLVDHREPDRPRVLQRVPVVATELDDRLEVGRSAVVLVQEGRRPVVHGKTGVAERAVVRCGHRDHHQRQPVVLEGLGVDGADEPVEAQTLERVPKVTDAIVGQEHGGVLVHPARKPLGVVVVEVQVGHVEVVRAAQLRHVEPVVGGERVPRREVRRREPRIAQDRAVRGLDVEAGVTDGRDAHAVPSPRRAALPA